MGARLQLRTKAESIPAPSFTPVHAGGLQRKCAESPEKKAGLRRLAAPSLHREEGRDEEVPPIVHEVTRSPGQPLDAEPRVFFEPRFGHDFSKVRVHHDGEAAESARAVNARAFTLGRDIVFGSGQYAPETSQGRRLLAHELTHVIQQRRGITRSIIQRQPQAQPSGPTSEATAAAAEAERLMTQTNPCIWFDSWENDRRDNDRDGEIDERDEKTTDIYEHYPDEYPADICGNDAELETMDPDCNKKGVNVIYRVCIDIPRACYGAAGIPFPNHRNVTRTVEKLKTKYTKSWKVLMEDHICKGTFDGTLAAGDFVADVYGGGHGHSGIAVANNSIVHLPGPSRGLTAPSTCNDIVKTDGFNHSFVARPQPTNK